MQLTSKSCLSTKETPVLPLSSRKPNSSFKLILFHSHHCTFPFLEHDFPTSRTSSKILSFHSTTPENWTISAISSRSRLMELYISKMFHPSSACWKIRLVMVCLARDSHGLRFTQKIFVHVGRIWKPIQGALKEPSQSCSQGTQQKIRGPPHRGGTKDRIAERAMDKALVSWQFFSWQVFFTALFEFLGLYTALVTVPSINTNSFSLVT